MTSPLPPTLSITKNEQYLLFKNKWICKNVANLKIPPTPLPCGHHKYVVPYYAVVYQQAYLANNEMIWHNHGLQDQVTSTHVQAIWLPKF